MSKLGRLEEVTKLVIEARQTLLFHENSVPNSVGQVANKNEIVACVNLELQRLTAEYDDLKSEYDYHQRTRFSEYGGSGDYGY